MVACPCSMSSERWASTIARRPGDSRRRRWMIAERTTVLPSPVAMETRTERLDFQDSNTASTAVC